MTEIIPQNREEWVERISQHELPALCSTIREIDKLSHDDTSSLARLGQTVLHDHALTSAILKVANSASYRGHSPVTTVSRASVVLGLTTIKNICLTAKLLHSLLKNRKLTPRVYERLLKLMAQSFHAGMIARMMMEDYGDELQEETFIAALLNRFGESAFWSMGGKLTVELDEQLRRNNINQSREATSIVRRKLGITFEDMSLGLAESWNLGKVLISSLEEPELRTPELQTVHLAVELSDALADPKHDTAQLERIYRDISTLMKKDIREIRYMIEEITEQTVELLQAYGVGMLTRYLQQEEKDIASAHSDSEQEDAPKESDQGLQLQILRELAFLPNENADFNMVAQTAMEGIQRGIRMHRTLVLLKTKDRKHLLPRFISAPDYDEVKQLFRIPIGDQPNIFRHVLYTRQPLWVADMNDPHWHSLVVPVRRAVGHGGFFLSPIMWGKNCIGIFYADRNYQGRDAERLKPLSQEDYMAFTLFTQQTNLCLSQIIKH